MVKIKNKPKKSKQPKTLAQKIILLVIILAIISVTASVCCALIFNTKFQVESKISHLASDYYENYFYPNIFSGNRNMSEILEYYNDIGFSRITLRQIFLSDNIDVSNADFIRRYCDENSTILQYFPDPPYDKKSYHVEYTYSCSF